MVQTRSHSNKIQNDTNKFLEFLKKNVKLSYDSDNNILDDPFF